MVRDLDEEVGPACAAKGLGLVAWSPMAGGYLAGKYTPGSLKVQGTRSAEGWGFNSRFFAPNHGEILQTLLDVAKELGRTPAQVALRWVMDQPNMTSAIVGARNAEQLKDTLAAGGWRLPAEALARLNKVSAQPDALSARIRGPDAGAAKLCRQNAGDGVDRSPNGAHERSPVHPQPSVTFRERFGALRNLRPFLAMVWRTSPAVSPRCSRCAWCARWCRSSRSTSAS